MGAAVRRGPGFPTRRALVAVWVGAAVAFAGLLAGAERVRGPLDDPDPARQRPGLLDLGPLPIPAAQVVAGIPAPGRRAVVFFERPERLDRLCRALARHPLPADVDVALVLSAEGEPCASGVPTVADPTATYARRFGLAAPRAGGPPVGYAVVDSAGRVRYRTLDPSVAQELAEVATIVAAVP